jgi:hypothetical protein
MSKESATILILFVCAALITLALMFGNRDMDFSKNCFNGFVINEYGDYIGNVCKDKAFKG